MKNYFILMLIISLYACKSSNKSSTELTNDEKVNAVKEILKQSVDNAVATLGVDGGFTNNDSLKITLPSEAQAIINIQPQVKATIDTVMIYVNQAAQGSIEVIAPIIKTAIDSMSVNDVNHILMSKDAAATEYLKKFTYKPLHTACEPVIISNLDKNIVAGITPRDTWTTLAGNYNKVATSGIGKLSGIKPVDSSLDEYVTDRILSVMFALIANEEIKIRKHPATQVSQTIVKALQSKTE